MSYASLPAELNRIGKHIVNAAYRIHKELGPGLLEAVYEECLIHELVDNEVVVDAQVNIPIYYREKLLESHLRIDLLVEKSVIVELKAVEALLPVHQAQLLTYLRLANKRLGYLINFNVPVIKAGIKRMVL